MGRKEWMVDFAPVNFERRKHPRIAVNLPIEYWKVNESRIHAGCTGDISEGGCLLYLPEKMEVGQKLRLRLFVDPGFDFMSIEAPAQVVWRDLNIENGRDCRLGVKFPDISARDERNLRIFLNSLTHLRVPSGIDIPFRLLLDLGILVVEKRKESLLFIMRA